MSERLIGDVLAEQRRRDEAELAYRSALVPGDPEAIPDEVHTIASERAATLIELGEAELALGRVDDALAHCGEAVALEHLSHGPDSWQRAIGLLCLGRAEQARGAMPAARVALERAAAILGASELARHVKAAAHEALARVLLVEEPARARELAQQAAAGYLAAGPGHADDLARVHALRVAPTR